MKTLTFYSGKLWYSEKPPLIREHFHSLSFEDNEKLWLNYIKQSWLSTAYEVVNPEVIPGVGRDGAGLWINSAANWRYFKDGDQITLPDGYGIKYTLSGRIEFKEVGHSEATTKTATIITPEKPENSAHGDCKECTSYFGYPMSKCFHCKPKVSEPSESQEELMGTLFQRLYDYFERGQGTLKNITDEFTITRK